MTLDETVLVLDLDDTLYQESDYHQSGIRAVCAVLARLHNGRDSAEELLAYAANGGTDLWAEACRAYNLPDTTAASLLWTYRLHSPSIALSPGTKKMIELAKARCRAVAILTDGRSVTQRLKLTALGLSDLPSFISEEHGSEKPEQKRFAMVMEQFPAAHYIYVGDNPTKDFIAPNALGWTTIGLAARPSNIHPYDIATIPADAHPHVWIAALEDLFDTLTSLPHPRP
jgi:putative hydrolase of the HAD superfamily